MIKTTKSDHLRTMLRTYLLLFAIVLLSGDFIEHFTTPGMDPVQHTENSAESNETENEPDETDDLVNPFIRIAFCYPNIPRITMGKFTHILNSQFDIVTPPPDFL